MDRVCAYVGVDDGLVGHGARAQRDVAAGEGDHAGRGEGDVGLLFLGRVEGRWDPGVPDGLVQVFDVGLVDEAAADDFLGADRLEFFVGQLLEAVCDARGRGVWAGEVVVEESLGFLEAFGAGGHGSSRHRILHSGHDAEDVVVIHAGLVMSVMENISARWHWSLTFFQYSH